MKVYPNSQIDQLSSPSHPVFQYIENKFWNWIESSNPASEYKEMYFGEDAIFEKRGAIVGAIENALDEANESGKPVDLSRFDIECAFE